MRPEVFDILIIGNIIVGLVLAGRRLVKDLRAPLSDDVSDWSRDAGAGRRLDQSETGEG